MRIRHIFIYPVIVLLVPLVLITSASAANYSVFATVPFPAPTQAAELDSELNGYVSSRQVTDIYGTCQVISPLTIISVWRGASSLGSVNCEPNGTFRLSVSLAVGQNTLIIRSSSLSTDYGPDSAVFTITYLLPNTNTPTPEKLANPVPVPVTQTTPVSDLTIAPTNIFELLAQDNSVTIEINVVGGQAPYTITIQWGDGTTESRVVASSGLYLFQHTFDKAGIYRAIAKVVDVKGASSEHAFVITTEGPLSTDTTSTDKKTSIVDLTDSQISAKWYLVGAIISVLAFISFGMFLGMTLSGKGQQAIKFKKQAPKKQRTIKSIKRTKVKK